MCRKVTCEKCGKPTWAGCGQHVEQTLKDVPPDQALERTIPLIYADADGLHEVGSLVLTKDLGEDHLMLVRSWAIGLVVNVALIFLIALVSALILSEVAFVSKIGTVMAPAG